MTDRKFNAQEGRNRGVSGTCILKVRNGEHYTYFRRPPLEAQEWRKRPRMGRSAQEPARPTGGLPTAIYEFMQERVEKVEAEEAIRKEAKMELLMQLLPRMPTQPLRVMIAMMAADL